MDSLSQVLRNLSLYSRQYLWLRLVHSLFRRNAVSMLTLVYVFLGAQAAFEQLYSKQALFFAWSLLYHLGARL